MFLGFVLKEIDSITIADLQAGTKNLWSKGFGQALIQGNLLSARGLAASCSVRSPIL